MEDLRLALLRDLERALLEALAESAEAHRALERMHDEGLTLQIYLDCQRNGEPAARQPASRAIGGGNPLEPARVPASAPAVSARALARVAGRGGERRARAPRKNAPAAPEPLFRINSEDLAMLRALGIDPTRKGRARR
jgi:hypothetical protein